MSLYQPLIEVRRGSLVESVHHGSVVVIGADGAIVLALGDVSGPIYPRSAAKPLQAAAMLDAGCPVIGPGLALAASSHSGEPVHVATVLDILASVGLTVEDLQNEPDLPLGETARESYLCTGGRPDRVHQNCSGKHAAMLATCVANGWSTQGYLEATHPLQVAIRDGIERFTGEAATDPTRDGCGAPLFATSLTGLATAFAAIATAPASTSAGRVAAAMRAHPRLVGGAGRDVTALLEGVPGCIAKDGAEGLYAIGLSAGPSTGGPSAGGASTGRPSAGGAVAVKLADGGTRGRLPAVLAGLAHLGLHPDIDVPAVLGGGHPVGAVVATF